ncbi:MAG TPA: hypothetical protein VMU14_15615 [Acidimicrobiales bacterium]|nr:hypothetical protein [Acidimicrobiales bacterium]
MTGAATPAEGGDEPRIGWPRAIATAVAVLVVGIGGAVFGANAILTKSLALTRTAREWLATALFFAVLIVLAAALRWLQHKKLI